MTVVLASASPRRRHLLTAAGVSIDVRPADVDETPLEGEAPDAYALRVARDKALAHGLAEPVLAADTVVALGDEILGKAEDVEDAKRTLAKLSGESHVVHTAVVLAVGGEVEELLVTTAVRFRALSSAEIDRYVATGEPMDKAGAYGIQGEGGALVAEVRGSYTNVVGLPLEETLALLAKRGLV
ncbi:MAG: Maf family protein [Deltaproteobacteria bacterium]